MSINNYEWADSNIESILIEYDKASLVIWNDSIGRNVTVVCSGFAGITNLCIWDDTIIESAEVHSVEEGTEGFVDVLFEAYDKDYDYGGRKLKNGLLELRILLVNKIPFSLYCQSIHVLDSGTEV